MTGTTRPAFDAYALPLPRRRAGPAAAVSFLAHVAIAVLVLWRGAALFESGGGGGTGPRGGGGGGGRPAVSWFALPAPSRPQAQEVPAAPDVTVPMLATPVPEAVKIDVPLATVLTPPPAPVGTGGGTAGGPGQGPGTGGGKGTGTGPGAGADSGSGSGGDASYIFPASPRWTIFPPPGAPREARGRRHEVRFWVTAEGRVTRVEVTPPIKDAGYRREFTERMMGYLFNPAMTRDGRRVDYVASVTVIP
ncbi:MAG: hypothetical protein WD773_06200 [Gemmatimonadales bacterium]